MNSDELWWLIFQEYIWSIQSKFKKLGNQGKVFSLSRLQYIEYIESAFLHQAQIRLDNPTRNFVDAAHSERRSLKP